MPPLQEPADFSPPSYLEKAFLFPLLREPSVFLGFTQGYQFPLFKFYYPQWANRSQETLPKTFHVARKYRTCYLLKWRTEKGKNSRRKTNISKFQLISPKSSCQQNTYRTSSFSLGISIFKDFIYSLLPFTFFPHNASLGTFLFYPLALCPKNILFKYKHLSDVV